MTEHASGPLAGVRVVEFGTLIAGPFAGRMMADFGADVVKIEEPGRGDPLRTWGRRLPEGSLWSFVQNRGKRSVALDLHREADRAIAFRLASQADVLIENFRPGRMEEWGLGPQDLEAESRGLVYVRISGFGQTGPLRTQPGFGSMAEAIGGIRHLTGRPDEAPVKVGLSIGDSIASLFALNGALLALRHRDLTGMGQVVDVALTEAVFSMLESVLPDYGRLGVVRERTGDISFNSAPTNIYATADGRYLVIGANADGLFRSLMTLIDRADLRDDPDLAGNPGRVARRLELDAAIQAWTGTRSLADALIGLRAAEVPSGSVNTIADIVADPQFQVREMILKVDSEVGELLMPGIVPKLSLSPGSVRWAGPRVGEHTAEVLARVEC